MKHRIIVIGGDHHNTLGVVRSLGESLGKGYIILLSVFDGISFVTKSKYLNPKDIYNIKEESCIVEKIIDISKNENFKPVIICCGDTFIDVIDRNYDILKEYCILPNAGKAGRISKFLDKEAQCIVAQDCGMDVPSHCIIDNSYSDFSKISFPCILKPINSILGEKSDINIFYDLNTLIQFLKTKSNYKYRVEKYIKKLTEFQLIGCSLDNNIIIPGYTTIIRQPKNTNTGYLKYSPIDNNVVSFDLLDKVYKFINNIGYKGLFSVEFIKDDSGKDFFLEINMRNDGNAYCVKAAGVNLPYIWAKYADIKNPIINENTKIRNSVYLMPELNDIKNINKVGIIKWTKEFIKADAHTIFDLKDFKPFVFAIYYKIKYRFF